MTPPQSLRTLLTGVIDYAGLFPPASLSVDDAVSSWRRYRTDESAWMLGRFVCPRTQLDDLARLGWTKDDGRITLIANGDSKTPLANAADAIQSFPDPDLVDAIETTSLESRPHTSAAIYLERPVSDLPEILSAFAKGAGQGGLKFRTGGVTAAAFPTSANLARAMAICRDAGVFWKATAGLHHPLPNVDASGGRAHGFINLLTASVLAHARRIDATVIQAILDDDRPDNFRFSEDSLAWTSYTASLDEIAASRRDFFRSFGSCSFLEPRDDLAALNWFRG